MALWKPSSPSPQPIQSTPPAPAPVAEAPRSTEPVQRARPVAPAADQTVVGKGIAIKGEIAGGDALFIDGEVEGKIEVPGERVTVGPRGRVAAASGAKGPCIVARDIVLFGKVVGNIEATERVDIRANASLTGNISTARITIEDGAFFRGGIDIRQAGGAAKDSVTEAAQLAESAI